LPRLRFAGQITGVEGYVESAAIGLLAGRFAATEMTGAAASAPPATTALGALLAHITGGADARSFQPMNINFGLFPPLAEGAVTRANRGERKPLTRRRDVLMRPLGEALDDARQRRRGPQREKARDVEAALGDEIGRQGETPRSRLNGQRADEADERPGDADMASRLGSGFDAGGENL